MVATPANPGEALWIGSAGGKNHFNVGIGNTEDGTPDHTDYSQALIEGGFTQDPEFLLVSGNLATAFKINAGAGTTSSGTVHPRCELRELTASGSNASWDGRTGEHYMRGRSRITDFTSNRPWVCFFQVHDSSSDLARIQTEGAIGATTGLDIVCRRTPPGGSEIRTVIRTGYSINTWVSWEIRIDAGRLRVILDGVTVLDVTGMGTTGCYFKTGCYLQDNVAKGASASDTATVEMEAGSLQVWHTGYPAPTTPIYTGADGGSVGDTIAPTVPQALAAVFGDTQIALSWQASTDNVGVANYKVRRSSGGGTGTAGKTTDGTGSTSSSTTKIAASAVVPTVTGTITGGHARAWLSTAGSANTKLAIWADSAGAPGALLATSDQLVITATTEAVRDYVFSGANIITLTGGVTYWLGLMWQDPGTPSLTFSRDANANSRVETTTFTYGTAPNPFGTPTTGLSGPIDAWVEIGGTTLVASPTGTTYVDTGLTNGTQYGYTVSAIDAAGNESAPSDQVLATPGPPDVTPPTVPGSVTATAGDRRVTLSWTASTDAVGVALYRVYRNGILRASPLTTTYTDTDLPNGVAVSYTVSAVDTSGNESAQSSAAVATPSAPAIGGVPFLTRDLGDGASIAVEIAFGADLAASPEGWTWTDVTDDVRQAPGISTSLGRNDESSTSNPADLKLDLDNSEGDYSLGGRSRHYPYVRRNTPVRVRIDPDDGGGGRVVFFGGADGWKPGWDTVAGRIPIVTLSASGTLRRLGQGTAPAPSALRRAMTSAASVVAYWPMEEGELATYAPAVKGAGNMEIEGTPEWAASSDFYCSAPLPAMKDGRATAYPNAYTNTGAVQIRFLLSIPENATSVPTDAYILSVFMSGSISRWDVLYGPGDLTVNRYTSSGALHSTDTIIFDIAGRPGRLSLELQQVSGNIAWRIGYTTAAPGAGAGYFGDTITGHTMGTVGWVQFNATQNLGDVVVGHLTIETALSSLYTAINPLLAYQGDVASSGTVPFISRIERLCSESNVPLTRHPGEAFAGTDGVTLFDTMGPQLVNTLLDLLREAEAADQGQLWDGRSHGLSYTTRRRREDGTLRLTIDAAAGELAGGFEPVDDDQRTRNRVEVKRTFGITAGWEDTFGPLGTANIGVYDESVTVNTNRDREVVQHAQWRVAQGTIEGYRYPSVTVDLRASPRLAAAVLDIIPGERIDVVGLDETLAGFAAPAVSLIVEGIGHEITGTSWLVTLRCSPFEGWGVGRVAADTGDTSDMAMRVDTDGSTLAENAAPKTTSLRVATTSGAALWTTSTDDYPMYLSVGGVRVRATACSGASSPQTFTVDRLTTTLLAGDEVALWQPRRVGMG